MQPNLQPKKARLNVQISSELKNKLYQLSAFQGEHTGRTKLINLFFLHTNKVELGTSL